MPISIIREDITRIKCDCIVCPTDTEFSHGGGVDAAIHAAAGKELAEYCRNLLPLPVGEAKISPGFGLYAKYVVHTVGPVWQGGGAGERAIIRSCYRECMRLALEKGARSVAFPLISAGVFGYPTEGVLSEASSVISEFLIDNDIEVYIVVYDKDSYSISRELYGRVESFIDDFYIGERFYSACAERRRRLFSAKSAPSAGNDFVEMCASAEPGGAGLTLEEMLEKMDKGFGETLFYYIDKKGISDVEAYKRSNIDKKTFSKIKCNPDYRPSKVTAFSFAIGLHLNIDEARHLLSTAGLCLSRSEKFDVIIEYFLTSGNYKSIFDVNETLYQFDQALLGV